MKINMWLGYSDKTSFLSWNFFQRPLETFLWTLRTCSSYLKCLLNLALCVSKISWPHDTPIKFYVMISEKCWDFEKMKLKIGLEYSDKTPFFIMFSYFIFSACKKRTNHRNSLVRLPFGRSFRNLRILVIPAFWGLFSLPKNMDFMFFKFS